METNLSQIFLLCNTIFPAWVFVKITLKYVHADSAQAGCCIKSNQVKSNVFIKPFLHQLITQSAVQKPSLKPQTASNAGVEARWLGTTP